MTRTANAERQQRFRERHLQGTDSPRMRLNTIVPITTKFALTRLAHHYGVTEHVILEDIISAFDDTTVAELSGAALKQYYDVTR